MGLQNRFSLENDNLLGYGKFEKKVNKQGR